MSIRLKLSTLSTITQALANLGNTEGYTFHAHYTKYKELYTFHSDGESVLNFLASIFTIFNCTLRQSPLLSAILFFNILELFLVFIYHKRQILILKETSNYMTLLLNNSSQRKTSWLCTKNDVRLQPRSQEEAGWSKATDIRIANYVRRPTLVLFAIIRKIRDV